MDPRILDQIIARLPPGRTLFHYFPDRYALQLLEWLIGDGQRVGEIKRSWYGALLKRPTVRSLLARLGTDCLRPSDLLSVWPDSTHVYRLTVDRWPFSDARWSRGWHQMVRRGKNLVLQLNFTIDHNRQLGRLAEKSLDELRVDVHPVARGREFTLAWSRLDLDLDHGEALIEEIQSDWPRFAPVLIGDVGYAAYHDRLAPHARLWAETMLASTLSFLRCELGVHRIFCYTYGTGLRAKRFGPRDGRPPRSIYSDLPRRFCFRRSCNPPLFLRDERDRFVRRMVRDVETDWFVLEL
jgi:hypothetical protein